VTVEHVTWEALSDYCADLLPSEERAHVDRHLASCADCSTAVDSIQHVRAALADIGEQPLRMPPAVWQRLESALAQEAVDQGRGGAHLPAPAPPAVSRRPRRVVLAAAAAVLAVAGAGVVLQRATQPSGHGAASAAATKSAGGSNSQRDASGSGLSAAPLAVPGNAPTLSPGDVANYARRLTAASKQSSLNRHRKADRAGPTCVSPHVPPDSVVRAIRWRDAPAVLIVNPAARHVRVLSCHTGTRVLYATSY
jgi:hypothetical protein